MNTKANQPGLAGKTKDQRKPTRLISKVWQGILSSHARRADKVLRVDANGDDLKFVTDWQLPESSAEIGEPVRRDAGWVDPRVWLMLLLLAFMCWVALKVAAAVGDKF